VIACNNSDVWNETGDTLEFSIAPAYYQTPWFYASCVVAFLAILWGLYRLRLYQIRREFDAQLDGRVGERMRVARELHDTLLQSFQAALIQMQAARNILDRRPEKVAERIDKAINMAADAVAEGRSAIQDLRVHPASGDDLSQLLTAAGQELAHSEEAAENPPVFRVTVEGERRDLEPLLQDEVYRIARELLRNAFRHAQAGRIEAEIRFESRHLRVHIRDDGKGMDSEVLKAGGRAGHFGLAGMRERAERFGGKLEFWSEAGAGTEAVLTVPAAAAYGASNGGPFSFLRRKLWIHER
jgi:signal transduction histidine kinase